MAKRILLADDSITIQKVVELTFSDGDYEVTAVNNGAKAIQKLSDMRPDIILSDIIMPEKNGYEVCEFVKSHPEYRTIPVVLLTGTFEPFDPDRADKAGCDAVVTKPFESQSLIHKVEELIEHAKSQAPTAPATAEPSAFSGESPFAAAPPKATPPPNQFATGAFQPDVFGGQATPSPRTSEIPFEGEQAGGETRAFPRINFNEPPVEPASPWDEQGPAGGETRAFPKMSFEDIKPPAPASPWEEPAPTTGETRAFPRMGFDDLQQMASEPTPPPETSAAAGHTTTPPPFEAPTAPPPSAAEPSPWDEQAAGTGETRAFPRMSFDDLEKMAPPPAPEPSWTPPPPLPESEELPFKKEAAPPPPPLETPVMREAAPAPTSGELTDEQIDRIARRVIQLMSDQVIRNIAWEVIPDVAEMLVKERIRQLESES
jgi:CheY-like chemotaxis protein